MASPAEPLVVDPAHTPLDAVVLRNLADDIRRHGELKVSEAEGVDEGYASRNSPQREDEEDLAKWGISSQRDQEDLSRIRALNDPKSTQFQPTVIQTLDHADLLARLPPSLRRHLLLPYTRWARTVVRHDADVVMLTHLIVYFSTTVPSALLLFRSFSYAHALAHLVMQGYLMGTYTLMMHQHIHQRGILGRGSAALRLLDAVFPYVTDPLMGHTWNTYFYHHVKHHHVEGNGPDDLSSTVRYQRDELSSFLHYVARFYFLIWFDLPLYFWRKGKPTMALKAAFWELSNYAFLYLMYRLNVRAATFVYLLPLLFMRVGLMVGNWGQHAFVDADEPDSDFRSSITLIDVQSNRFCYNDGYHTSHHLNPLRHWRDHPVAFLSQKETYVREKALVFHNIDYIFITIKVLQKDYMHLARCLVPIGEQIGMTLEERAEMLRRHTRRFSEEEIREKFGKAK